MHGCLLWMEQNGGHCFTPSQRNCCTAICAECNDYLVGFQTVEIVVTTCSMFEWGMTGMTGEPMKYMILGDWKKPEWPVRAIIPQQLEQNLIFSFTIYTCTQRTAINN